MSMIKFIFGQKNNECCEVKIEVQNENLENCCVSVKEGEAEACCSTPSKEQ